jgi:hypothetical protein
MLGLRIEALKLSFRLGDISLLNSRQIWGTLLKWRNAWLSYIHNTFTTIESKSAVKYCIINQQDINSMLRLHQPCFRIIPMIRGMGWDMHAGGWEIGPWIGVCVSWFFYWLHEFIIQCKMFPIYNCIIIPKWARLKCGNGWKQRDGNQNLFVGCSWLNRSRGPNLTLTLPSADGS